MQIDLSISDVLALINCSSNPGYTAAILDGKGDIFWNTYPKVGIQYNTKNGYRIEVTDVSIKEDRIRYKYYGIRYYENDSLEGNNSREKSSRYQYPKVDTELSSDYRTLEEFQKLILV